MDLFSQVPWTEAQWTRVQETVRDEAKKQRVGAAFLPVDPLLSEDTQTAPLQTLTAKDNYLQVDDYETRRLTTISVHVGLRSAQVADQELSSALLAFRRAANLIARAEDELIFAGQPGVDAQLRADLPPCQITGGNAFRGLMEEAERAGQVEPVPRNGQDLVQAITRAISILEQKGHLGPFAVILGTLLFDIAHDPSVSLVLPADRIKPMIDGPLLRSTTLNKYRRDDAEVPSGLVVSLAEDLIDLAIGSEIGVKYLQVTAEASPRFMFRVSERFTLRVKQPTAIVALSIE